MLAEGRGSRQEVSLRPTVVRHAHFPYVWGMSEIPKLGEILMLPAEERLAIVLALWESLAVTPDAVPIPDWHRDLLDERLAIDDLDQSPGEGWSDVRRRLERQP
jgi:putative addiction module component (TIGR02574 family)